MTARYMKERVQVLEQRCSHMAKRISEILGENGQLRRELREALEPDETERSTEFFEDAPNLQRAHVALRAEAQLCAACGLL